MNENTRFWQRIVAFVASAMFIGVPAAQAADGNFECEFTAQCDETGCKDIAKLITLSEGPDQTEFGDELEVYPMLRQQDARTGDVSYAATPAYGSVTLITRFATGQTIMSIHFSDGISAGALTYYGSCSE